MSAHIKTWRERAELAIDWPCFSGDQAAPYMKQEIADLRAALTQKEAAAPGDLRKAIVALDGEKSAPAKFDNANWYLKGFADCRCEASSLAALAHPVAVDAAQDWISIHDRLPETEIVDDSECWLSGKRISAAIASQRVLVALIGGGVRVDRLAGLDGNKPYWDTYNLRVTHWMPLPAGPAIDAAMKEKP